VRPVGAPCCAALPPRFALTTCHALPPLPHSLQAGDWTAALHALVAGTNDTACSTITVHQQDKPGSDLAKPSSDLHIVTKDVGMPAMSDLDDASTVRSYSPTASVASSMRSALFKVSMIWDSMWEYYPLGQGMAGCPVL
jgi:hypothetical protein